MEMDTQMALAAQAQSISDLQAKVEHLEHKLHHLKEWGFMVAREHGIEPPDFEHHEVEE